VILEGCKASKVRFAPKLAEVHEFEVSAAEVRVKQAAMKQIREHMIQHMIELAQENANGIPKLTSEGTQHTSFLYLHSCECCYDTCKVYFVYV
jgi:hypothetical protein